MKYLTIKKAHCAILLVVLVAICSIVGVCYAVGATSSPKAVHTIVIDAGHGGKDGGAIGKQTGVTESYLNLQYANALSDICKQYGYRVVMTRKDMNGLYSPFATNKKKSEMEKRKQIIEKSNADLVVSIHMNSFPSEKSRGAQVFYQEGSTKGQTFAESVQKSLNQNIEYAKAKPKSGDFFVLNCSSVPSILIECGFLSNSTEEVLLQDEKYINQFCYFVVCGILTYFSFS